MPEVLQNIRLKPFNTFGIDAIAQSFMKVTTEEELSQALEVAKSFDEVLILGGGSNILLTGDYSGLVIKLEILGFETIAESDSSVDIRLGAGEVWHETVLKSIQNGWGGIENMSLIPGTVGAAPMQNIGAYGVEIKKVFVSLEAMNRNTGEIEVFNNEQCSFGYRESVFKKELKDRYVITRVTLRLNKNHTINAEYGDIKSTLSAMNVDKPSISDVSKAVISIRQSKLPNPAEIGNAGSFFKNPVIPTSQFDQVKAKHPDIVGYPAGEGLTKVAAGWLIDQAGWKGYRKGDIGVHDRQALVLVNHGSGKGEDIFALAMEIKESIKTKFGIDINPEVNLI